MGEIINLTAPSGINAEDSTPIPDWWALEMDEIYGHLNPQTKKGQSTQRAWHKCVVDSAGKPLTSIGLVANHLLKILTSKKIIPDTPFNSKLQSKKQITNGKHNTLKR
jgi:hypothetical protein